MGGKCPHRSVKKRRYSHKTARRTKFELKGDDAVYDQLKKPEGEKPTLPLDEDLPGMGQYYCLHCDRYFANVTVRDEHFKTKRHKKREDYRKGKSRKPSFCNRLPRPKPRVATSCPFPREDNDGARTSYPTRCRFSSWDGHA